MATPTLAKSPHPENSQPGLPQYDGALIDSLSHLVEKVERPKPPKSELEIPAEIPTDDERRERNAQMLCELWKLGEQMAAQAFEIPQPKPDPLLVALNGFPDVNTSQNYYDCAGGE